MVLGCVNPSKWVSLLSQWLQAAAPLMIVLLTSCGTPPPSRVLSIDGTSRPAIKTSSDGLRHRAELSVLTYNIEGLGWPARTGRSKQLAQIGQTLRELRERDEAPDIVMFQEMFSGSAKKAVLASGYPAIETGPRRTTRTYQPTLDKLPGKAKAKRGEFGLHLTGSGIAIASRYPIIHVERHAYGRRACAGLDCLANKGIMLARIAMPGLPAPIDLYNTHMNSRGASKAPAPRNLAAHDRQALAASRFIAETEDRDAPQILGGDFNMRHSEERWENFSHYHPLDLVHETCAASAAKCEVLMSWDGDEPWMDTQDLQFYASGAKVAIRPIRVEAMFDGTRGERLSDHDGFLVTYELRWSEPP